MGQEIDSAIFKRSDFKDFHDRLMQETHLLEEKITAKAFSGKSQIVGYEVEAWLIDQQLQPAPLNEEFLQALNDPMACSELAMFNIELNNTPTNVRGNVLSLLHTELTDFWKKVSSQAKALTIEALMIGILPTLKKSQLNVNSMTKLNRYRALNEQILRSRGEPVHLDITGREHLKYDHNDVMLESAATSFQLHLQVPFESAHEYYNAAILSSFATVAVSANSPFLFGKSLWEETRIPLFEQAIETGGYHHAARGPVKRVSFGSGYARDSIFECFAENLQHFPVLLPRLYDATAESFEHLRLHNGTIWRWNRPLVGFDEDGKPHFRIEHRVIPAGPTIVDMIANAAFYYGLLENFKQEKLASDLPFSSAKNNFYQAARSGLEASVIWLDQTKIKLHELMLDELLPRAIDGLEKLEINDQDISFYMEIIRSRVTRGQTGACWQRKMIEKYPDNFQRITSAYLLNQKEGKPVHHWAIK